ncbi:MAG: endonuclease/exonuclease/phosphatase family protein [Gammaproteobacteria bacterium]|nr:endonuclease/exonuclease/phosphatase family protein [Gammaproteobacteria bacterium]
MSVKKNGEAILNKSRIKLLSYNIQVGIASTRPHHYVTQSWKHVFPHGKQFHNLDQIADIVSDYDIVGLQEVDAGSMRSEYINQTEYLAVKAQFPYWSHQTNRRLGNIAQHSNGLLSKFDPLDIVNHKLPGRVPGRGAMVVRFGEESNPMIVVLLHLALGRKARMIQINYISELVREYEHVVVMGDMNCQPSSEEFQWLINNAGLTAPACGLNTFPSWKPTRKLDHILVSPSLVVENVSVVDVACSDHLPISMDIVIPEAIQLVA